MKIRSKYHIAGRDIKILRGTSELYPQLRRPGQKDYAGDCNLSKSEININSTHSDDEIFSTLWHESIHALDEIFSIGLNEEQVKKLERGIVMILNDNFVLKHRNNPVAIVEKKKKKK